MFISFFSRALVLRARFAHRRLESGSFARFKGTDQWGKMTKPAINTLQISLFCPMYLLTGDLIGQQDQFKFPYTRHEPKVNKVSSQCIFKCINSISWKCTTPLIGHKTHISIMLTKEINSLYRTNQGCTRIYLQLYFIQPSAFGHRVYGTQPGVNPRKPLNEPG